MVVVGEKKMFPSLHGFLGIYIFIFFVVRGAFAMFCETVSVLGKY